MHIPSIKTEADSRFNIDCIPVGEINMVKNESQRLFPYPINNSLYSEVYEDCVPPSSNWKINNVGLSNNVLFEYEINYQFPESDNEKKIPIFLFDLKTRRLINSSSSNIANTEFIAVYPINGELTRSGGNGYYDSEPIELSDKWHKWQCSVFKLDKGLELIYKGPDITLKNTIKEKLCLSEDIKSEIPSLESDSKTPAWILPNNDFPIITDIKSAYLLFSKKAKNIWHSCKLIHLDESDKTYYLPLNFENKGENFIAKIDNFNSLSAGVYEIHLRGSVGIEDAVFPFIYLPIKQCEKNLEQNKYIANSFDIQFSDSIEFTTLENTSVLKKDKPKNYYKIGLNRDNDNAFCALQFFPKYPITILFARSSVRWVRQNEVDRQNESSLLPWKDWRINNEVLPIQRLNEIKDAKVLIEIDIDDQNISKNTMINCKTNKLKVLLQHHKGDIVLSENAPKFKKGKNELWVIDLKKFAGHLRDLKDAGHADIILDGFNSEHIKLFSLLRYPEFNNFSVKSKGYENKKEKIEINWQHHQNDPSTNRYLLFRSLSNPNLKPIEIKIPDGKITPIDIELDLPEKPDKWEAAICIKESRFSKIEASAKTSQWCRIPESWGDWIEFPHINHNQIPDELNFFKQDLKEQDKAKLMPWSSFLSLFHSHSGEDAITKIKEILGEESLKELLPLSSGKKLEIKSKSNTNCQLNIISELDLTNLKFLKEDIPADWCQIKNGVSFEFRYDNQVWSYRCDTINKEPVLTNKINKNETYLFSKWIEKILPNNNGDYISSQIPIYSSIWSNPHFFPVLQKTNLKDIFRDYSFETNSNDIQLINNVNNNRKSQQPRAFADALLNAFAKDKTKLSTIKKEMFSSNIEPADKAKADELISKWKNFVQDKEIHPLIKMMIEERLKIDELNALTGAAALLIRLKAHKYNELNTKYDLYLSETVEFVKSFRPQSFLRDLILSEIIVVWYWNKKIYEFQPKNENSDKQKDKLLKAQLNTIEIDKRPKNLQRPIQEAKTTSLNVFNEISKQTILDESRQLLWQKAGSDKAVRWNDANLYIINLNKENFAGYSDWRMPTLNELSSLLCSSDTDKNIREARYILPIFSKKQVSCWSSDMVDSESYWYICFFSRNKNKGSRVKNWVRAVRSI